MTQLNASRFSKQFSLTTPIALAPMALASGGALAAACARAGALGLVLFTGEDGGSRPRRRKTP